MRGRSVRGGSPHAGPCPTRHPKPQHRQGAAPGLRQTRPIRGAATLHPSPCRAPQTPEQPLAGARRPARVMPNEVQSSNPSETPWHRTWPKLSGPRRVRATSAHRYVSATGQRCGFRRSSPGGDEIGIPGRRRRTVRHNARWKVCPMVKAIVVILGLVAFLACIWWAASAPAKGPGGALARKFGRRGGWSGL